MIFKAKVLSASFVLALSLPAARVAFAADNLDDLLHEADRALGQGHADKPQQDPAAAKTKKATKPNKKPAKTNAEDSDSNSEDMNSEQVQVQAKPEVPKAPVTLTPIDPARVSEILALDLQTQERERMTRAQRVSARVGFAYDQIPAVYQVQKDDDFFTIQSPASMRGASVEANRSIPLGSPFGAGFFRGSMIWGVSAGAAALQGTAEVTRSGIEEETKSYDYQVFPIDGSLNLGWMNESGFSFGIGAGYGADVVRQIGAGQTDTFTAIFSGELLGFGTAWRSDAGYEVFANIRQRGVISARSKDPTQSRIAGRMITLGVGCPI